MSIVLDGAFQTRLVAMDSVESMVSLVVVLRPGWSNFRTFLLQNFQVDSLRGVA